MNIKKINLAFIFLILCFILSFAIIVYCFQYTTLIEHDFWLFYNRHLFDGQHGRFITTLTQNILVQRIPDLLNIHPQDSLVTVTLWFKAFLIILCILLYSFTLSAFKEKKFSITFLTTVLYLTLFTVLFNDNYIFNDIRKYFSFNESAAFFEYPITMLFYIPFWYIYCFLFMDDNNLSVSNKPLLIIGFSILAFILATSIEIINAPTLMSLFIFFLIVFKSNIKNKLILYIATISYIVGTICFLFDEKDDFTPTHFHQFMEFVSLRFFDFVDVYFNFFIKIHSLLLIPIIILLILISFMCRKNQTYKKFITLVSVNIICIFVFFFLTFFLAGTDGAEITNIFPIIYVKWLAVHKMTLIFYILLSLAYFLDNNDFVSLKNNSDNIKILICITVLFIFRNNLIIDYISDISDFRQYLKENRTALYKIEKLSLLDKSDNIIIPSEDKEKFFDIIGPNDWFLNNFNYVHKTNKNDFVYVDNIKFNENFTKKELEELKFTPLITIQNN